MLRRVLAFAGVFTLLVCVSAADRKGPESKGWWGSGPWMPKAALTAPGVAANSAAPSLDPVLGPGADVAWTVASGKFTVERDAALNAPVLRAGAPSIVLDGRTRYPAGVEIRAMVRFKMPASGSSWLDLTVGRRDAKNPADPTKIIAKSLRMYVTANKSNDTLQASCTQDDKPLHNLAALAEKLDWAPQYSNDFPYVLHAYRQFLPGWPEEFRAQVEHDMAELPSMDDKWVSLRVELDKGLVRFWMDDRLVAWKQDASIDPEGTVKLGLNQDVQLASFSVSPLSRAPGYLPIRLDGYTNARTLLRDAEVRENSLPQPGEIVGVEGVPFVFPGLNTERHNHIDVGRSLLRQANTSGYIPTMYGNLPRWRGSSERDPARIQLRIPNGQYESLYVIAACDDEPDRVPVVSAMFYRPGAGYTQTFEASVPLAVATSSEATRLSQISAVGDVHGQNPQSKPLPLPVTLSNGKSANLWLVKIPLDPAMLSSFSDIDVIEIELTKKAYLYRSYPDPISYGYHQGGLPSAVHVYAMTLSESPVGFAWTPDKFGHVWTAPEVPSYTATLTNHTLVAQSATIHVTTRSYDGTEASKLDQKVTVQPGQTAQLKFAVPVKLNGTHEITATMEIAGLPGTWTERRSFARLAPDTRSVRWTEGRGAMFGYWSYGGGHHTPKGHYHTDLMTLAGARQNEYPSMPPTDLMRKHWGKSQTTAYYIGPQPWAANEKHDPKDVETFLQSIEKAFVQWEKDLPEQFKPDVVNYFTESQITSRLTAGNFPEFWQDPPFVYTDEEKSRLRMFMETARIAGEYLRKTHPDRKLLIEWGSPVFIVPLLRAGFPKNLIDGSSLDMPLFERLPEMQLADNVVHQLYELKEEYKKYGMPKPRLQYCEGSFVPTEPGAVSYREQMDIYTRWTLISMAYGVDRFYAGWFAFDCGNYYGAEHYGGCGIQRRIPYCDPKPAYAAFATMTQALNEANFDGWVPTGSLSTYCLRFKKPDGSFVYALWTIRGMRTANLKIAKGKPIVVIDSMNNPRPPQNNPGDKEFDLFGVATDPSVVYVTTGQAPISEITLGSPDNTDAIPAGPAAAPAAQGSPAGPGPNSSVVADLGDGSWKFTSSRDEGYENNHWGYYPALGKFSASVVSDAEKGKVLASKLEKQDRPRQLMPWYNTLRPAKPITLAGAPSHLGLWVQGSSDWGRVVYVLRDAKGERWISIGTKDDYNCNDIHCWSCFNFDGWRYLRFELPGHLGYDSFRKHGTTWWRSDAPAGTVTAAGDNIVDLPLALEEIIVEQRTHVIYVNDVQPAATDTVSLGKLYVEYENAGDAADEAVRLSRLRMPMPAGVPDLPNPVAELASTGVGAPPALLGLKPPEHFYDGTRMHVLFKEVAGATKYNLWVSAHADGRGAVDLVPAGIKPGDLVTGLRPGVKLYYWITYVDAKGKTSKPSAAHAEVTVDNFKEK